MSIDSKRVVLIDLDGTLVDSAPDLADALDLLLAERGLAPIGLDGTRRLIGHGIASLVQRGLAARGVDLDAQGLDLAVTRFRTLYADRLPAKACLYPGVRDGLDELVADGFRLAVCTNKLQGFSTRILAGLGVLDHFALVAGPDTFGVSKPDPRQVLMTLEALGATPSDAVLVGDSEADMQAGRAAGVPVIAVTYGYAASPLEVYDPYRLVGRFAEVPAAVRALMKGR